MIYQLPFLPFIPSVLHRWTSTVGGQNKCSIKVSFSGGHSVSTIRVQVSLCGGQMRVRVWCTSVLVGKTNKCSSNKCSVEKIGRASKSWIRAAAGPAWSTTSSQERRHDSTLTEALIPETPGCVSGEIFLKSVFLKFSALKKR